MKRVVYRTEFVDRMPSDEELEEGVLYVAPHFGCAVHKCMCGCGEKVVTPIIKGLDNQWTWTYDGNNVSLSPSVGNFSYDCRSHYFLRGGKVVWCWHEGMLCYYNDS